MTIVSLSPTLDVVGARIGMCTLIFGCGLLIGQPVAGTILGATGKYLGLEALCASAVTLCAVGMLFARLAKAGRTVKVKV